MPAPATLHALLPAFEQPTAADARNLKTARAYGARIGQAAPLDVNSLDLGREVAHALAQTGASTGARNAEAEAETAYVIGKRRDAAHAAGVWCPTGGCHYCTGDQS